MKVRRRVVIGIDTRIVGGELLHLVEAVLDRVELGLVAQMPLAREVGLITILLEELGDRRRFLFQAVLVPRSHDNGQCRADRDAAGDERGTTRRTARLTIPAGERRAFRGDAINVGGRVTERLAAACVGTEITPADVVHH